jgi:flagellar biosynthesis component FlhA
MVKTRYGGEPMLLVLAAVLLILAVVGGIAVHPLLFLIAILAVVALVAGRL